MEIKLEKAGIALSAKAHNPSIISPDWIKKYELIDEEPEKFLHTPEVSLFTSKSIHMIIDRNLLQVTTQKIDSDSLLKVIKFIKGYLISMPQIPYEWIDLNYVWIAQKDSLEVFPKIKLQIGKLNELDLSNNLFPAHELNFGCIVHAIKKPYFLRLKIHQRDTNTFENLFSYHHSKDEIDENNRISIVENFINLHRESLAVVEKIYLEKGE